jgi:PKD repeat protein
MENFNPRKLLFLLLLLTSTTGLFAQAPLIWGSSPFQDSLWSVDTTSWSIVNRMGPTMAGFTVTGINGLAWDPIGHKTYIIAKTSTTRYLGTIDLTTGVITQIGNLGMKFATINFRADGQLFGVTGNGQTPNPETMFLIDKNTATSTLAVALGNGADGEILCYNYDDQMFYHWSGNGTMVMEKFPSTAPYTPVTNIPTSGISSGETFGAIYLGNNNFIISNINSEFKHVSTGGSYGAALTNLPDDFRGLVLPPRWTFDSDTICVNDTVNFSLMPGQIRDTTVYDWGDGSSMTVFPVGGASHVYTVAGNYTAYAILKNDSVGLDTMVTFPVVVRALPGVALSPGSDTIMCFADTLAIAGAFGGTSQWYMNGAPISGANTFQYSVTADGAYNMIKTNLNGCSDSASVGIKVTFGDQPAASNMADSTICEGDTLCFASNNPGGVTYLWSNGSTASSACFTSAGVVTVDATDPAGCVQMDSATISVILAPNPTIAVDASGCPVVLFSTTDPNGINYSWNFGDNNAGAGQSTSHTYTANGTYIVTLTESNSCISVPVTTTVTINCIVGIQNGLSSAIQLAPNPSHGRFTLSAALPVAASLSYQITDLSGRILLSKTLDDARSNWSEIIDLNAAQGMYFITVTVGEQRGVYRLVIE